jgi:type II secretory pathway predicted ATPase ExeA
MATPPTQESADLESALVVELAATLVTEPDSIDKLLHEHQDDGTGHCLACVPCAEPGKLAWPCIAYRAAQLAVRTRATAGNSL